MKERVEKYMSKEVYYLHTDGSLIYKKFTPPDLYESPFIQKFWYIDTNDRWNAWKIVLEAIEYGAKDEDIKRLVNKWWLTFEDSLKMIKENRPLSPAMKSGMSKFIPLIFEMSETEYWEKVVSIGDTL